MLVASTLISAVPLWWRMMQVHPRAHCDTDDNANAGTDSDTDDHPTADADTDNSIKTKANTDADPDN